MIEIDQITLSCVPIVENLSVCWDEDKIVCVINASTTIVELNIEPNVSKTHSSNFVLDEADAMRGMNHLTASVLKHC